LRLAAGIIQAMKRSPRSRRPARVTPPDDQSLEHGAADRLQKVLAAAGVGSRRHCEEMILAGRVEVDGQTVTELGLKVDPARQKIIVDGEPLRRPRLVYFLVNKPEGVLSTNYDPGGRPRVLDLLPEVSGHLFTVGRLDQSSEGLILVTNDGELANRLTHPRYGVPKTYQALVAGEFTPGEAAVLTLLEIVLSEGRNREIRRLLARVGHKVLKLKRVAIASVRLGELNPGEFRRLRTDELEALKKSAREGRAQRKPAAVSPAPEGPRPKPARGGGRSGAGRRGASRTAEGAANPRRAKSGQKKGRRP
jgi:23S rRNA pseudouridine2605 synthase